jgi:hypothetical protein
MITSSNRAGAAPGENVPAGGSGRLGLAPTDRKIRDLAAAVGADWDSY